MRQDDSQFPLGGGRTGVAWIHRASQAHSAREPPIAAFSEVIPRGRVWRRMGFCADDKERGATDGDANRVCRDTGHINHDFHRGRRLEDVERRPAFSVELRDSGNLAVQVSQ